MEIKWTVTFAYSGSGRRELFDKEFFVKSCESIDSIVSKYVREQNAGEAKSDRIRVWSKRKGTIAEYFFNGQWNRSMYGSEGQIQQWVKEGERTRFV